MSDSLPRPIRLVFGDFFDLRPERRIEVLDYLGALWQTQFGGPPSSLSADLDALDDYYKPKLTTQALRRLVENLDAVPGRRPPIDAALCIPLDDRRALITAEGRALLEVAGRGLSRSFAAATDTDPDLELLLGVCIALVDFYSEPQRAWLRQTLTGGDLRPATLGYIVFLLLNNSVGRDQALRLPKNAEDDERLAGAVLPVVNAFASGIGGAPLKGRELTRMRSNWAVARAASQLPGIVHNEPGANDGRLSFIARSSEQAAIDRIAEALVKRRGFNAAWLEAALDDACQAFDRSRPLLLGWSMSWDSTAHTRQVCESLIWATRSFSGAAE